ncbi:MAG: PEGA domain-containing protein, partial [Acetatifactor sp.]|nr:PEGA domain-containing protein [Acetatifactor sp.]
MKRTLAFLLTAALMLNAGLTAYASESNNRIRETVRQERIFSEKERSLAGGQTASGQTGQVDVVIGSALVLKSPVTFSVELKDARGGRKTGEIVIGGENTWESRVSFASLAAGDYTLTVTAKGFAAYSQTIAVGNKAYAVNLMTGFVEQINYGAGTMHP